MTYYTSKKFVIELYKKKYKKQCIYLDKKTIWIKK